tara:strand:+ start:9380 stop:9553 length:174 start_codon:yes stop_codon:yes gene_type:complete
MAYSTLEKNLIKKAKKIMLSNPNKDFDTLAEKFIQDNSAIDEMILCDCLTEAYEQIN